MNDLPWLFFGLARHGQCPHAEKWGARGNTAAKDSISLTRSRLTPSLQRLHADTVRTTLFWRVQTYQCLNGLGSPRPPYLATCLLRDNAPPTGEVGFLLKRRGETWKQRLNRPEGGLCLPLGLLDIFFFAANEREWTQIKSKSKNTRLRSALGQLDAQSLLVHELQRPRTQDFADSKGTHPRTRREVGSSSPTFLEYICVHWRLLAAESSFPNLYSIFFGGRSLPPTNPRRCGKQGHGVFESMGRRGSRLRVRQRDTNGAQASQGIRKR